MLNGLTMGPWGQRLFVLNVKALLGAFNHEKALAGVFSVIVKTDCETDGSSAALLERETILL